MPSSNPVYSTQFVVWDGSGSASPFLVPAGAVAVIRDFTLYAPLSVGAVALNISQEEGVTPVTVAWLQAEVYPVFSQWTGRVVVPPGGVISIDPGTAGFNPNVYVGGYLLAPNLS